jgi:hypothetical protein
MRTFVLGVVFPSQNSAGATCCHVHPLVSRREREMERLRDGERGRWIERATEKESDVEGERWIQWGIERAGDGERGRRKDRDIDREKEIEREGERKSARER